MSESTTMEEVGIKESMEVLAFVETCVAAMKKAKEDGVADWKDLLSAETRAVVPAMLVALKDSNKISSEMKNLSPEEVTALLEKLTQVVVDFATTILS